MKLEEIKGKVKNLGVKATLAAGGAASLIAGCPALAMAKVVADTTQLEKLTDALATISTAGGILCVFGALILFAMGKIGDGNGARGEGMMVGLALAGIAFFIASVFINTALKGILG